MALLFHMSTFPGRSVSLFSLPEPYLCKAKQPRNRPNLLRG